MKFRAAVGRREERDLDDLKALAPGAEECRRAANWLHRTGIDAEGLRRLHEILTLLRRGTD